MALRLKAGIINKLQKHEWFPDFPHFWFVLTPKQRLISGKLTFLPEEAIHHWEYGHVMWADCVALVLSLSRREEGNSSSQLATKENISQRNGHAQILFESKEQVPLQDLISPLHFRC